MFWYFVGQNKFQPEWLSLTFSMATVGNGVVAISAGVVAGAARDAFGLLAPFDLALCLLLIGSVIVWVTWEENYGNRTTKSIGASIGTALGLLINDPKIFLLGIVQSCFDGPMVHDFSI